MEVVLSMHANYSTTPYLISMKAALLYFVQKKEAPKLFLIFFLFINDQKISLIISKGGFIILAYLNLLGTKGFVVFVVLVVGGGFIILAVCFDFIGTCKLEEEVAGNMACFPTTRSLLQPSENMHSNSIDMHGE